MGQGQSTPEIPTLRQPSIFTEDVVKKFENFTEAIKLLSDNDPALVSTYVDKFNNMLPPDRQNLKIVLSEDVKKQLDSFHKAVTKIATANGSLVDDENFQQNFGPKMKNQKDVIETLLPKAINAEMKTNVDSLNTKVKELEPFLKNNTQVQKNVTDIVGSVVNLKSRYSYFEYKYIQLNIFMLALFTNYNAIITGALDDVLNLVTAHDKAMSGKLDEVFKLILALLQSNQISTQDLDSIAAVFGQMQDKLKEDTKKTVEAINTASKDVEKTLMAIRNMSATPDGQPGQKGGFVRGSSSFPQSFFELP
jgi:hypothetical protein